MKKGLVSFVLVVFAILLKSTFISLLLFLFHYLGSLIGFWAWSFRFFWFSLSICVILCIIDYIKIYKRNNLFSMLIVENEMKAKDFFERYDERIMFSDQPHHLNAILDGNMYLCKTNDAYGGTIYFKFTTGNNKEEFYINQFLKYIRTN